MYLISFCIPLCFCVWLTLLSWPLLKESLVWAKKYLPLTTAKPQTDPSCRFRISA